MVGEKMSFTSDREILIKVRSWRRTHNEYGPYEKGVKNVPTENTQSRVEFRVE